MTTARRFADDRRDARDERGNAERRHDVGGIGRADGRRSLNLSGGALTINPGGQLNLGGTLSQTGGTLTLDGGTICGRDDQFDSGNP